MISFRKLVQFLRNFYKIELIYSKKKNVEKKNEFYIRPSLILLNVLLCEIIF